MTTKININNTEGKILVDGASVSIPSGSVGSVMLSSQSEWTSSPVSLTWRNRITNGNMMINQRGSTVTSDVTYPVDRWRIRITSATASVTASRSNVAPPGFSHSLLWTTNTGSSSSSTDMADIVHVVEGINAYDFAWGTSSAKTVTLSFWVRCSMTGTFSLVVNNATADPNATWFVTTYSINAANTWEKKRITIQGPSIGTWQSGSLGGIGIVFGLGSGSTYQTSTLNQWTSSTAMRSAPSQVNVVGTTGATFYLTGVQLELGQVATDYEFIEFEQQLALCQRYYSRFSSYTGFGPYSANVNWSTAGTGTICLVYPQPMRASPTVSYKNLTTFSTTTATSNVTNITATYAGNNSITILYTAPTIHGHLAATNTSDSYIEMSADI